MHKVNSCICDSCSALTSDNYWTTQKFNRMNDNLPTYKDPTPPPMKKPEPPPTQIIQEGVLPPNNKIPIGEIREDVPTENKYFNAEKINI